MEAMPETPPVLGLFCIYLQGVFSFYKLQNKHVSSAFDAQGIKS